VNYPNLKPKEANDEKDSRNPATGRYPKSDCVVYSI
jgi:hypothetical protein